MILQDYGLVPRKGGVAEKGVKEMEKEREQEKEGGKGEHIITAYHVYVCSCRFQG